MAWGIPDLRWSPGISSIDEIVIYKEFMGVEMKKAFLNLVLVTFFLYPDVGSCKKLTLLYTGDMAGNVEPCG